MEQCLSSQWVGQTSYRPSRVCFSNAIVLYQDVHGTPLHSGGIWFDPWESHEGSCYGDWDFPAEKTSDFCTPQRDRSILDPVGEPPKLVRSPSFCKWGAEREEESLKASVHLRLYPRQMAYCCRNQESLLQCPQLDRDDLSLVLWVWCVLLHHQHEVVLVVSVDSAHPRMMSISVALQSWQGMGRREWFFVVLVPYQDRGQALQRVGRRGSGGVSRIGYRDWSWKVRFLLLANVDMHRDGIGTEDHTRRCTRREYWKPAHLRRQTHRALLVPCTAASLNCLNGPAFWLLDYWKYA